MKYLVILGDGMSDEPLAALGGKTCLEYARTPNLDALAPLSQVGLCKTVPQGLKPGSDVANMSVMGFDPPNTIRAVPRSKPWQCAFRSPTTS